MLYRKLKGRKCIFLSNTLSPFFINPRASRSQKSELIDEISLLTCWVWFGFVEAFESELFFVHIILSIPLTFSMCHEW
jgi:hypothetical protein